MHSQRPVFQFAIRFQVAAFCVLLITPFTLFLLEVKPEPYEGRDFMGFPPYAELIHSSSDAREAAASAYIERSWYRYWAVRTRNFLFLKTLSSIDTERVVSGSNGFLFYKPSLLAHSCDVLDVVPTGLRGIELLLALAEPTRLRVFVTMAPNKATVQHEQLGGRAVLYAPCYLDVATALKEQIDAANSPALQSHESSIVRLGEYQGKIYYRSDTHWMPHALVGVAKDIYGFFMNAEPAGFESIDIVRGELYERGDLGKLLLLRQSEPSYTPDYREFERVIDVVGKLDGKSVIIHDSFYNAIRADLDQLFASASYFHVDRTIEKGRQDDLRSALAEAERVIANSVERHFLRRLRGNGALGMNSVLAEEVLARNQSTADRLCDSIEAGSGRYRVLHAKQKELGIYKANAPGPRILIDRQSASVHPDQFYCLKVRVSVDRALNPQVFIPRAGDPYSEIASLKFGQRPKKFTLKLLIPPQYAPDQIRVDLGITDGEFEVLEADYGTVVAQSANSDG